MMGVLEGVLILSKVRKVSLYKLQTVINCANVEGLVFSLMAKDKCLSMLKVLNVCLYNIWPLLPNFSLSHHRGTV